MAKDIDGLAEVFAVSTLSPTNSHGYPA